jgi:hypothetical protein
MRAPTEVRPEELQEAHDAADTLISEVPQLPARADAADAARKFRDALATEKTDRARIADELTGKARAS